ncbi:MAG: energy transducer TonB, partial [Muribaculaceae bacterium]|nr:energy transducer TonB [Muribaculaceae bacterium]
MMKGKRTCKILKEIRQQIANSNDIQFITSECTYKGDCLGTCPRCEAEVEYLEKELNKRRKNGKLVALAGLSMGIISTSVSAQSAQTSVQNDQIAISDSTLVNDMNPNESDTKNVFGAAPEHLPTFPGGEIELMNTIKKIVKYPQKAIKDSIEGRVVVQFLIDKIGEIKKVKIVRSAHPVLDREVVLAICSLPKFNPGKIYNKPVDSWFTLGLYFTFKKDNRFSKIAIYPEEEQEENIDTTTNDKISESQTANKDGFSKKAYTMVGQYPEEMPRYPGGDTQLMKDLSANISYPEEAAKNDIQGRVLLKFLVKTDGSVDKVECINKTHPLLEEEAIRVIKTVKPFIPGKVYDKIVDTWMYLPINFRKQAKGLAEKSDN